MIRNFRSRFGNVRNTIRPLSNEELLTIAPAIGAENAFSGVSEKYSFIPTIEVVNILRDKGWTPVQAKQANVRIEEKEGYQKHLIRFQRNDLEITSSERVDLVLYNSHDRGCAFNLMASVWRKICSNGLMVSSDLFNFSHRHIGFNETSFLESAHKIVNGAGEIAAHVDKFKEIELTPDERGVFAMAALNVAYDEPEKAPIFADRLLTERRMDDKGKDLWTTYNVIQENLMKGGLRGKSIATGKPQRTREVKSIDKDIKLNKALWVLTSKMAEIKAA